MAGSKIYGSLSDETKWATFSITLQEPFSVNLIHLKHMNFYVFQHHK